MVRHTFSAAQESDGSKSGSKNKPRSTAIMKSLLANNVAEEKRKPTTARKSRGRPRRRPVNRGKDWNAILRMDRELTAAGEYKWLDTWRDDLHNQDTRICSATSPETAQVQGTIKEIHVSSEPSSIVALDGRVHDECIPEIDSNVHSVAADDNNIPELDSGNGEVITETGTNVELESPDVQFICEIDNTVLCNVVLDISEDEIDALNPEAEIMAPKKKPEVTVPFGYVDINYIVNSNESEMDFRKVILYEADLD